MTLTLSASQRDALYDQILDRLSGIGDIELAINGEDYERAERLGREYSDDLCLLLDDLGLGDGAGEWVELSSPPEVLKRVLPRLRRLATRHTEGQEAEWIELEALRRRNRLVVEACDILLPELEDDRAGEQT
jgi:hypothetical protein